MSERATLAVGLMSGTSLDGMDAALVRLRGPTHAELLAFLTRPYSDEERAALRHGLAGGDAPSLARLHVRIAEWAAEAVEALLAQTQVPASELDLIAFHGQTIWHEPPTVTWQLGEPAILAERFGVRVVSGFRTRDVAAGGQGAPLAPFFHRAVFGRPGETVGVLNVGGISNLTLLRGDGSMLGFDCGPGNALMDAWCAEHIGTAYDAEGDWAAFGTPIPELLERLLAEPYFDRAPPKSTGRDLFNMPWLEAHLRSFRSARPQDIQATLAELTACACAADAMRHEPKLARLIVCGGGALNGHLMRRFRAILPAAHVGSSAEAGLPPLQVEATAFAWLARKTVQREKLALESTTGARGARVLGCVYPA
jgi:anhydro-N-acetylmuramic acid kinase